MESVVFAETVEGFSSTRGNQTSVAFFVKTDDGIPEDAVTVVTLPPGSAAQLTTVTAKSSCFDRQGKVVADKIWAIK